ncbi:MAG: hypothetical protein Q8K60_07830 [Parachlamydiaceae bacterium]|nr:hypothetical protein [Parachlamydiaceae bacterium]
MIDGIRKEIKALNLKIEEIQQQSKIDPDLIMSQNSLISKRDYFLNVLSTLNSDGGDLI